MLSFTEVNTVRVIDNISSLFLHFLVDCILVLLLNTIPMLDIAFLDSVFSFLITSSLAFMPSTPFQSVIYYNKNLKIVILSYTRVSSTRLGLILAAILLVISTTISSF